MLSTLDIVKKRRELWENNHDIELDKEFTYSVAEKLVDESIQGEALRKEIKDNPERLIEMCFSIVNKEQETVPFFLNNVQIEFAEILNTAVKDYKLGKRTHLKFLVLKGRQQGFTTFITAYQLARTITSKNFTGMTVADSSENSNTIFEDKAKYPYSMLPPPIQPEEKYNTRKELIFSKLNSKWRIATAGNKDIGRSKTVNFFHGSEAAFWDSIQQIMGGLGQALTKDSIQILESTANGFNEYRQLWSGGEKKENNWQPLFFEWWKTPEYVLKFTSNNEEKEFKHRVLNPVNEFEKKLNWLLNDKKLSWEQLNWYDSKGKDLKELLPQEYPCTPLEAFLSSGLPIFDNAKVLVRKDYLEDLYKKHPELIIRGRMKYEYINERIVIDSIEFVEDVNGPIEIYKKPERGHPYVIGGDTAEGGEDFCIGQVLDNSTGEQVAKYRERTDTDLYAKQMFCLGYYYNKALLGIEMNFDLHPTKELERLNYPNQYMREHMDDITGKIEKKYGWNTNKATRPVIVGDLVEIVRECLYLINDLDTLSEMITFIKGSDGKPQAAEGEHDDCVMALAIAYKIRGQHKTSVEVPKQEKTDIEKDKERLAKQLNRFNKRQQRQIGI